MKYPFFLLLSSSIGLIYSCSETIEKESTLRSINDFLPSYLYEVPNIVIEPGNYYDHVNGRYRVDAIVDSVDPNAVFWIIKDSRENRVYQGYALDGKKNGWWEVLQNKTLICCGNYISNRRYGFWRYFKLAGESQKFVNFKNDTLDGLAQEFSADSILLSEGNYVRGLKSDYWKYFYNSGNIRVQGYFYDGFKSGWWQSFESNGNLFEEASYSRNEISGYMKKYLKGIIFEEGKFFDGKRRGMWKTYDGMGKLNSIHEYGE